MLLKIKEKSLPPHVALERLILKHCPPRSAMLRLSAHSQICVSFRG